MDIGKDDKIKLSYTGVVTGVSSTYVWIDSCAYARDKYDLEVIEKAGHDHSADPFGTMYVDDEGHKWIKLPASYDSGVVYRRIDKWSVINEESDSGNRLATLKPIAVTAALPKPEVGDRRYGWADSEGDNWWWVTLSNNEKGWVPREDRESALEAGRSWAWPEDFGQELSGQYGPYTLIPE